MLKLGFDFVLNRSTKNIKENMVLNSNDRFHFHTKAMMTHKLRELAYKKMIGLFETHRKEIAQKPIFDSDNPCGVIVTVYSPTKRRLDPPNLYPTVKALIDGMTDAAVWTDDNHEVIKSMTFRYGGLSDVRGNYVLNFEIRGV